MARVLDGFSAIDQFVADKTIKTIKVLGPLDRPTQLLLLSKLMQDRFYRRLEFHNCVVEGDSALALFAWISILPDLVRLALTEIPGFGIERLYVLFKVVGESRLTHLDVSGLGLGVEGGLKLASACRHNRLLRVVIAHRNGLQSSVMGLLALPTLHTLGIGNNDVHAKYWPKLLARVGPNLVRLFLPDSGLSAEAWDGIINFLRDSTLSELDVSGNPLPRKKVRALCYSLMGHATLAVLGLNGCDIRTAHIKYIGQLLGLNQSIECLHLQNNPLISAKAQLKLLTMMDRNFTLTHLSIDMQYLELPAEFDDRIDDETVADRLMRLIQANQELALKERQWAVNLHKYQPKMVRDRVMAVLLVFRPIFPIEIILHILSFWPAIQYK